MKLAIVLSLLFLNTTAFALPIDEEATGVWCTTTAPNEGKYELIQEGKDVLTLKYTSQDGSYSDTYTSTSKKTDIWDGHASGIITGDGFSMFYRGNFGCVVAVDVIIHQKGKNIQRANFPRCLGVSADYCQ